MFISKGTFNQLLASSAVLLNEFTVGLGWGWVAPVLVKLQTGECNFESTEEETSWIASISEIGRLAGSIFAVLLVERVGRQKSISFVSLSLIAIWIPLIFTNHVWVILTFRILFGILNGISDVVSSIYLSESLTPNFRGIAGGIVSVFYYDGMFIEFILGTYLSYIDFTIVNAAISACGIFGCFFVIETPYFEVMKGRYDNAEENLKRLQGYHIQKENIASELEKIKQNVQAEKQKKYSLNVLFTSSENMTSLLIILGMYFLTSAIGYAAITVYSSLIFVKSSSFTPNEFTILFGIAQFIAACISPFIVERYRRRTLIIVSFIISTLCHGFSSALLTLNNLGYEIIFYPWLIFISITACSAISAFIYPIIYILRGEVFPLSIKAIGGSLAIFIQSVVSFLVTKIFLVLNLHYGMQTNFFIYLSMSIITVFYTYFFVPETRGKTLIEIQIAS